MMPFVISCLYTIGSAHRYMYLKIVTEEDSENYTDLQLMITACLWPLTFVYELFLFMMDKGGQD